MSTVTVSDRWRISWLHIDNDGQARQRTGTVWSDAPGGADSDVCSPVWATADDEPGRFFLVGRRSRRKRSARVGEPGELVCDMESMGVQQYVEFANRSRGAVPLERLYGEYDPIAARR